MELLYKEIEQARNSIAYPKFNVKIAASHRYFFPELGRVKKIRNADKFDGVSWVHRLGFFVKQGEIIEPVTNHTKRAGFVITTGETRDQAIERAVQVVNTIEIETVDDSQ